MSEFYTRDEVRSPSIPEGRDDSALDESARAEDELTGAADVRDNSALSDSFSNTNFSDTTINGGRGDALMDEDVKPIDTPLSAGSVPNSTMEADLGPAPTESFTNTGGTGTTGLDAGTGVNAAPPMSAEPLADVTMPYNDNPTPTPAAPMHLSEIKSELKEGASHAVDQAKEKTSQVVTQVKETAGQAVDQAKEQVVSQLSQQKDRAAETLTNLTTSVHQVGDTFRQNNLPQVAEYAESLAGQVDRVGTYLRNNDVDVLARDAERFARENAAAVLIGSFIIGLTLGRFLRASSRNMAYNGERNALVPVQRMDQYGNVSGDTRMQGRQDINRDDTINTGDKPLSAHGYVPGGVVGGAPA
jgi:hypothetical protein